jgi:hypothetical protein
VVGQISKTKERKKQMTSVMIQCKFETENKGMDFEIRMSQDENVCNEEKSAAMFLLPYVQKALELALEDANKKLGGQVIDKPAEGEIVTSIDGGPTIVTLD